MQPGFANDMLMHGLVRDALSPFASRRAALTLAALAVTAGLAGPFGTYLQYETAPRLLYWTMIVVGTAAVGNATANAVERWLSKSGWSLVVRLTVVSVFTALPVCLVVALVSALFGYNPFFQHLPVLYVQCIAVIGCFAVVSTLAMPRAEERRVPATPALLKRLPAAKRGRLIRLIAQDHYVEVVTDKGRVLLPMRFRDAVAEASAEAGVQTHRSHWVALDAIDGHGRSGGKPGLRLKDGGIVPVGRTFRTAVKRALDL